MAETNNFNEEIVVAIVPIELAMVVDDAHYSSAEEVVTDDDEKAIDRI